MKPLSAREERFCQLVAAGQHTQTAAYTEAGYSPRGADAGAARLSGNVRIQARIAELGAPAVRRVLERIARDGYVPPAPWSMAEELLERLTEHVADLERRGVAS